MVHALALLLGILHLAECTDRPIIGVLAQEASKAVQRLYPGRESYIAASYVKAVHSAGARVAPVFVGRDSDYYRKVVESVNGVLLPGGSTWFYNSGGYADAGQHLFQEAKAVKDKGSHFPILGICLGMELLLFLDVGRQEYRADCRVKDVSLPLHFRPHFRNSSLFGQASEEAVQTLAQQGVTYNQHQFCVTERNMSAFGLSERWKVLSTNEDRNFNLTFVSAVESKDYPFAGVQFHPEKNGFEWRPDLDIAHSPGAVRASRLFLDWLVTEARRNDHRFSSLSEEQESLIYSYCPEYTQGRLVYDQVYLFGRSSGVRATSAAVLLVAVLFLFVSQLQGVYSVL